MSASSALPNWLLLDPFVFDRSFPDDTEAPIRASGTSSGGDSFRIAFSVAKPPQISRLYAQLPLPERSRPHNRRPVNFVATHRHLALVRFTTVHTQAPNVYPEQIEVQNFFILDATDDWNSCSSLKLKELPACTEPLNDYSRNSVRLRRRRRVRRSDIPRLLMEGSLGLWCGDEEEFVVAELTTLFFPFANNRFRVYADICYLCSSTSSDAAKLDGQWESIRLEIMSTDYPDDVDRHLFRCWYTDSVIPFQQWLCWIDCHLGIIFCDVSKLPIHPPTISFVWFPLDKLPCTTSIIYCGVSVVDHGRALKFVRIDRSDGIDNLSALKPDTGFTITCHTLVLGTKMGWKLDYKVTSTELWEANPIERFPCTLVIFPRVDIHRPQVLHLVAVEFVGIKRKMSVVSIDINTKTVVSCSLYMDGITEDCHFQTDEEATWFIWNKHCPTPFIPCEFPEFLQLSSHRQIGLRG